MPVFPDDPDVRSMLALKAGRENAMDELVQRHAERLVGFLRHYINSHTDAEDLAQETFASVWRVRASYQPVARFST
ncbi:MAG: hypothetical protein EXS14_07425 [Planctomycetes bacterium]|nr:hypothetical protein [Planctomycetota bacterium]